MVRTASTLFRQTLFQDNNIGSSYISDQPISLPNRASTSRIYLPFLGTRRLSTSLAIFCDTCINRQSSISVIDKEMTFGYQLEATLSSSSVTPTAGKVNSNPKCAVRQSMQDWWLRLLKPQNESVSSLKARRVFISA